MKTSWGRRLLRFIRRLLLFVLALILLVIIAVHLPFVQRWIGQQAANVLEDTLGTEVTLERVRISLPSTVGLRGLNIFGREGEELAGLAKLDVEVDLFALLGSRLEVDAVQIEGLRTNLVATDSSSNFQFLLDNFTATPDSTELVVEPDGSNGKAPAKWVVDLADSRLYLRDIDLYYQDDPADLLADIQLDQLGLITKDIKLEEQLFELDQLLIAGLDLQVKMPAAEVDTTPTEPAAPLRLYLNTLELDSLDLDLQLGGMQVQAIIEEGTSAGTSFAMDGEAIQAEVADFDLRKSKIQYDQVEAAPVAGIDPNHLDLDGVNVSVSELTYQGDTLSVLVEQVTGRETKTDLAIQELAGQLMVHPNFARVDDLSLLTTASELELDQLYLDLSSLTDLDRLELRLTAEGRVAIAEILRAQPALQSTLILGRHPNAAFVFDTDAHASNGLLSVDRLTLDGPGLEIEGEGQARNLADPEALEGTFDLARLSLLPQEVLPLLPDGLLPDYIDWPRRVEAQGSVEYLNQQLVLDFGAREDRPDMSRWSGFDVAGRILRPLGFPESELRLSLDSLVATQRTILAYLPAGILPPGYGLPDYVALYGEVTGPVQDLNLSLDLQLPGGGTYAQVNGNVKNATEPDLLMLDLRIADLALEPDELLPLLPDSLLPAYFVPPDLRIQDGRLSGSLDSLDFELPIATSNGQWQINGRYDPNDLAIDLAIDNIRPAELFNGPLRDTLVALNLQPISIQATVSGRLEPGMNLNATATIEEQGRGRILAIEDALITDNLYGLTLAFDHPSLRGEGEMAFWVKDTLVDTLSRVYADLRLEKVDLERWGLSDRPLIASGSLSARSLGIEPDQIDAWVRLDDILLRGDGATSYVDSLLMVVDFDNQDNEAWIESDVIRAELTGYFDPVELPGELSRFIQGYWRDDISQPEPVEQGRNFNLALYVFNPRPFVSGIIPGLTELSPLTAGFSYRERNPELLMDFDLERLAYNGLELTNTRMRGRGTTDTFSVEADWGNIALGEGFLLGPTKLEAASYGEALNVGLRVMAEEDSLRHELQFTFDQVGDRLELRLAPEQIINFRLWRLPTDNLLALAGDEVYIEDWELRRKDSYLRLSESDRNGLRLDFNNFKVETLARIINSEEELAAGRINGTAYLDEALTNPGIRSELRVDELALMGSKMGDLTAEVSSSNNANWQVDVGLSGRRNELALQGQYLEGGAMDLSLEVQRLSLPSLEPLSLGYLQRTAGFLEGQVDIGGSINSPRLDGGMAFRDAALAISLLGSRFRLEDERISFSGRRIVFDDFALLDSLGNSAIANGTLDIGNPLNIGLDLNVRAREFLAVNSTAADNDLFYGYLLVDADVDISGTSTNPQLLVDANPTGDSRLTYAYTAPVGGGVSGSDGIVTFAETYEWAEILASGSRDTVTSEVRGTFIQTNLSINDDLRIRVIIDPVTRQEFGGRGEGSITFIQYPNGRQELTGRIDMTEGTYDMVLEGLRPYEFQLREGSSVSFDGNPANPQLDLDIYSAVQTSALPLVQTFNPGVATESLRRRETFEPSLSLDGDLTQLRISADILYPEDKYGNRGLDEISEALAALRQDESRMYTTAITLITFGGFNIPLIESGSGGNNQLVNNVADAVAGELSKFLNNQLGFVDLQLGVENYETADGQDNYNVSLSLSRSFLDDRLIINVDGVANTAQDATTGESQTYLDNISAEYLLDPDGGLRIKLFNDRDRNVLVGGNVLRFGGRLVFSKDFNRFFWEPKRSSP